MQIWNETSRGRLTGGEPSLWTASELTLPSKSPIIQWYAFTVRTKRELFVADRIAQLGIEQYTPTYAVVRKYSDRLKTVQQPLFPGYVFGRLDIRDRLPILKLSDVHGVVGPWAIPGEELDQLRRGLASLVPWQPWPFLKIGDRVTIVTGPLKGMRGRLESVKGVDRLVIGVTLLQRAIALEVDRGWIRPDESGAALLPRPVHHLPIHPAQPVERSIS